jgi:hypothetical protein
MTLNMKTYKGFDKKPYCSAHYPHTKATVVADTPEMARIAHNTKIQSQVKYHEEFEKTIKGSKIEVTDDPESRRVKRIGSIVSQVEYKGTKPDARRQSLPHDSFESHRVVEDSSVKSSPFRDRSLAQSSTVYSSSGAKAERLISTRRIGSIADYDPLNENYGSLAQGYHPTSSGSVSQEWEETISLTQPTTSDVTDANGTDSSAAATTSVKPQNVSSDQVDNGVLTQAADDAFEEAAGPEWVVASSNTGVSDEGSVEVPAGTNTLEQVSDEIPESTEALDHKSDDTQVNTGVLGQESDEGIDIRGHVSDEALENDSRTNRVHDVVAAADLETDEGHDGGTSKHPDDVSVDDVLASDADVTDVTPVKTDEDVVETVTADKSQSPVFQAVYEYEAQDEDEVSFIEGDQIVDVQIIDEGWMFGKVVRTGKSGMLPSNYIEPLVMTD